MRLIAIVFAAALAAAPLAASSQTVQGIDPGMSFDDSKPYDFSLHPGFNPLTQHQICLDTHNLAPPLETTSNPSVISGRLRDMTSNQSPFVDDWGNANAPGGLTAGAGAPVYERIAAIAVAQEWTEVVDLIFANCSAQTLKQQQNSGLAIMCIGAETATNCRNAPACRRAVRVRVAREFHI